MVPLRGRLHRFAMETCSARVGPHTVFALAPCASWLKNALGTKRVSHCGSRRSVFWAFLYYAFWRCAALERLGCIGLWLSYCPFLSGPALIWIREIKGRAAFYRLVRRIANACPNAGVPIAAERVAETASIVLRLASLSLFFQTSGDSRLSEGRFTTHCIGGASYSDASLMFNDLGLYTVVFGEGSYHGRQDDLLTDFRALNHRNFLIFYKHKPQLEAYQPYFRKSELHRFTQYGARFYYVSGKDFQYPLYRDRVLRIICLSYWRIPSWLPARGNFFSLKYFGNETCASGQSTGSSHTQAR